MAKIHTVTLDGKVYSLGYKVVTEDMKSLGLRNNTNIHTYPIGEWYFLPEEDVVPGNEDWGGWGGFWVAPSLGDARKYISSMRDKYHKHVRIFKAALDRILHTTSCRIKTNGLILLEEIHHPMTDEHLPENLPDDLYVIADKVFYSRFNTPLSTDPEDEAFYFTVPEPILENLSKEDRKRMLRVLQFDQVSPRILSWYAENDVPDEGQQYAARDFLLLGTELAEEIEDEQGKAFARARIWHHAAGTCYFMSPEHQQIAVDGIDFLVEHLSDADGDTKAILSVWEHFIHNRMEDFLSRDGEMRHLREEHGVPGRD